MATRLWFAFGSVVDGYWMFLIAAPMAAFASGALSWWWLLQRAQVYTRKRAGLAGALAGAVAQYPCWLLLILGNYLYSVLAGGLGASLGDAAIGPVDAFCAAAAYSMFSLLFVGWVTVPVGALMGVLAANRRMRP